MSHNPDLENSFDEIDEFDELDDASESESNELFEHFHYVADKGQTPLRIDRYLVNKIENASRSKIKQAADNGSIIVNDKPVKSNYKVRPEDDIKIVMSYPPRDTELIPEDIPLDIVYEDDTLLIVNKPAGMVVHPGHGNSSGTLVNALAFHFKDLPLFSSGEARPGLVHRIDKNTTGILVIAKTPDALVKLSKQFFDRTTHRKYIALVWGTPKEKEGTITGNLGRNLKNRTIMQVFPEGDPTTVGYGKPAITHYKVIEQLGYVSLLECKLETGRTHQIRAHLKHIGHPLFNDVDYGGDQILKGTSFTKYKQFVQNCFKILPRHALHAKSLAFIHPVTNELMSFDSELPEDMTLAIDKWRHYIEHRKL